MIPHAIRRLLLPPAAAVLLVAVFAAPALAAGVLTEEATDVTATTATLHATIRPYGEYVGYAFQYGTTTEYGSFTPSGEIQKGETAESIEVSTKATGLTPNTTYHFRIAAVGAESGELVLGEDLTFTTLNGLYMTGEESTEEANQPKIASTAYPKWLFAEIRPGDAFTLFTTTEKGGSAVCHSGLLFGPAGFSEPSSVVSLGGGFSALGECTVIGIEATVALNGCEYVYHVANAGPPYTGSVEKITCPAGYAIEVKVPSVCTFRIPAQTPGGTVNYVETPYGSRSAIDLDTVGKGLTIEKVPGSGGFCSLFQGTTENTFGGDLTLRSN